MVSGRKVKRKRYIVAKLRFLNDIGDLSDFPYTLYCVIDRWTDTPRKDDLNEKSSLLQHCSQLSFCPPSFPSPLLPYLLHLSITFELLKKGAKSFKLTNERTNRWWWWWWWSKLFFSVSIFLSYIIRVHSYFCKFHQTRGILSPTLISHMTIPFPWPRLFEWSTVIYMLRYEKLENYQIQLVRRIIW